MDVFTLALLQVLGQLYLPKDGCIGPEALPRANTVILRPI